VGEKNQPKVASSVTEHEALKKGGYAGLQWNECLTGLNNEKGKKTNKRRCKKNSIMDSLRAKRTDIEGGGASTEIDEQMVRGDREYTRRAERREGRDKGVFYVEIGKRRRGAVNAGGGCGMRKKKNLVGSDTAGGDRLADQEGLTKKKRAQERNLQKGKNRGEWESDLKTWSRQTRCPKILRNARTLKNN